VKDDVGNDTYIRYSENDLWYRDFFKEHKRKPTVAELEDMVVAVVTGDASAPKLDGWIPDSAETAEAMAEAAPAIEKLRENLSVMERIKPHMKEMTSAEMRLTEGLSPEAFHVYRDLSKKLSVIGGQTAPVARLNAILFARHADIFANAVSKKTGEKLTAKDYYERFFGLDSEGKYQADLHQAVAQGVNLNENVPVLDFDSMANVLKKADKKAVLAYIRSLSTIALIPTADFCALVGIPANTDTYGQKHIVFGKSQGDPRNVKARNKTLSNLAAVLQNARVIDISSNTKAKPSKGLTGRARTVQERKNSVQRYYRIMVPIKAGGQLKTLIITAEDMNGAASISPQNVSLYEIEIAHKKGTPYHGTTKGVNVANGVPSHITIRDMLRGVKDTDKNFYIDPVTGKANFDPIHSLPQQVFNQIAWHGSPYWFEHFDLGMIGLGEGHQAHGWGLYFAKDWHISEAYKTWLEHMPKVHTKADTYTHDEEGRWILEKSGTRFADGSPVDQALMAFEGAEGDLAAAKEDVKKQLAFFQDHKMEKSVAIMREALDILEKEGGEWQIEHDKPMLYQVEIPDEEYMFYENMTVAAQNDYVKTRVEKVIASLTEAQRSRFADGAMNCCPTYVNEEIRKTFCFSMKNLV
jgi:hypothetical protein